MEGRVYTAKPGSRFSNEDAAVLGQEIERLDAQGELTPEAMVAYARYECSPLHRFFNWNDTEAAELYRRDRALYLIRNIEVHIPETSEPVKFVHRIIVKPGDDDAAPVEEMTERCLTIDRVKANAAWMAQVIVKERDQIIATQRRLRQYESVAQAIRDVTDGPLQTAIDMLAPVLSVE